MIKPNRLFLYLSSAALIVRLIEFGFLSTTSLSLDESGSWWVISASYHEVFSRSQDVQGQSPLYYFILKFWSQCFGNSEIALRSLSFVAYVSTCRVLYRFEKAISSNYTPALVAIFLSSAEMFEFSISARPYALMIFFSAWGLERYCEYLRCSKVLNLLICSALWILAIQIHYFAGLILLPAVILVIFVGREAALFGRVALAFCVVVASVVFLNWSQMHSLSNRSKSLSYLPLLGSNPLLWIDLSSAWLLAVSLVCGFVIQFLMRDKKFFETTPSPDERAAIFIGLLLCFAPLLLVVSVALCLSLNLLVPRYLSISFLGLVILGRFLPLISRSRLARLVAFSCLIVCSLTSGLVAELDFDRRGVADISRSLGTYADCKVLATPGFIETWSPKFISDSSTGGFASAPFDFYKLRVDKILPLAFETKEQLDVYEEVISVVEQAPCVALITYDSPISVQGSTANYPNTAEKLSLELIASGFRPTERAVFGEFSFDLYKRSK